MNLGMLLDAICDQKDQRIPQRRVTLKASMLDYQLLIKLVAFKDLYLILRNLKYIVGDQSLNRQDKYFTKYDLKEIFLLNLQFSSTFRNVDVIFLSFQVGQRTPFDLFLEFYVLDITIKEVGLIQRIISDNNFEHHRQRTT